MELPSPVSKWPDARRDNEARESVEAKLRVVEEPLLPRVARGEDAAVRACIRRYAPLVVAMSRKFFTDDGEVDDAVQDIFLELWRCAGRFDERVASEAAFVVVIARRRLIDRRRSRHRERANVDIEDVEIADDAGSPERRAEGRTAVRALEALAPDQRNVIVLSAVQGLAHQEIADELGMPLGTVKSHVRRGLALIREKLLGAGDRDE